jgi:Serine carboxypeptidase
MNAWNKPNGCKVHMIGCQKALKENDSVFLKRAKRNLTEICGSLTEYCADSAAVAYNSKVEDGRSWYDITHPSNDPFPPPNMLGYLTEESVLKAIGVPVNYTLASMMVNRAFENAFDSIRGGFLDDIAFLLESGVKIHMMYGDRDFACNWLGGELASLAIPYNRNAEFAQAGYTDFVTSEGTSGQTRQLGNLSFTRVYQAGHEVPAYQPIAAYEIFMRATSNRDIASGLIPVTDQLTTAGPKDIRHIKNIPPQMPKPKCNVLSPFTCAPDIWEMVLADNVTVKDWVVVDEDSRDGFVNDATDSRQVVLGD